MKRLGSVFLILIAVYTPAWAMFALYSCKYIRKAYSTAQKRCYKTERNAQLIEQVVSHTHPLFESIPGYAGVVEKVVTSFNGLLPHISKGALYELQVALDFYNRGHTICAFEKVYVDAKTGCARELDIITNMCCIECKNINWFIAEKSPHIMQKMHKQIKEQQALVVAGVVGVPQYVFCSRNEIPLNECNWLREQGVFYYVYAPCEMIY
jgi:hypothetical protein